MPTSSRSLLSLSMVLQDSASGIGGVAISTASTPPKSEVALFGEDWGNWRGIMVEGSTIFVTAKCVSRYGNSNYLDFKISTVEYLQTVKENRLEKFTISIDSSIVDDTLVNDLKTLVENDEGHAQLFIQIHDSETNTNFTMRAQDRSVGVSRELIQFVNDNPKMSYQIN